MLIEEMFLHVPAVMAERPEECFGPAREVMELHAREEKSHLAWDEKILAARRGVLPRWLFSLQAVASLVLLMLVDHKANRAWRRAVAEHAEELGLSAAQRRRIGRKKMSSSDLLGMRAFIRRRREKPFPGSGIFCAALALSLPKE